MIQTQRLVLRPWKKEDLAPFASLNADARVMEFFPSVLTKEESDALAGRYSEKMESQGWGFWAVSVIGGADFIGFIGLAHVNFTAPFTPAVEVGWRLAFDHWGKGYATEGALAALEFGFSQLKLDEIVSFTTLDNLRSRHVMKKLGMRQTEDFDHPKLIDGHPLKKHVLYRMTLEEWEKKHGRI